MAQMIDITGFKFGAWTVVGRAASLGTAGARWSCECSCGIRAIVLGTKLRAGGSARCDECRKREREDLIGKTFGHITVVASIGSAKDHGLKGRGQLVLGRCACGRSWKGRAYELKRGNTRSCGCIPRGPIPRPDRELGAIRQLRRNYLRHALRRELSWELTEERFRVLTNGNCHYCGAEPSRTNYRMTKGRRTPSIVKYNGIDRKDNGLGYTAENSVSCCALCNYAKRDLTEAEFLAHVKTIYVKHFGATV